MGKKYTIELERGETAYKTVDSNGTPLIQLLAPTPYTEPDLEQVRKEAYEKGYEKGFIAGHLKAEKSGQSFYEDGYKRGLADAWDAVRKIYNFDLEEREELFHDSERFNVGSICEAYSASEAIEKIRQHEQEKEEQIQVGDEIETPSGLKGYVVNFTDDELVHYVSSEGRFGTMGMSAVSKTGRHFPEIAEVLAKMKEASDG